MYTLTNITEIQKQTFTVGNAEEYSIFSCKTRTEMEKLFSETIAGIHINISVLEEVGFIYKYNKIKYNLKLLYSLKVNPKLKYRRFCKDKQHF